MFRLRTIKMAFFVGILMSVFLINNYSQASAPSLANYYLNILPQDQDSVAKLAKNDVLILSATQILAHQNIIAQLKSLNPRIIILAYLPSQSYNHQYWPNDILFRRMKTDDSWWLKNSQGQIISTWPGIWNINMKESWSQYLVDFANTNIVNITGVDGIFFDMIYEKISWASPELDLDEDGVADPASEANKLWLNRVEYLLHYAADNLKTKYIIINGSSDYRLQPYVNGRMFENISTSDKWANIMNDLRKNKNERLPRIFIMNNNTNNKGNSADYRNMRYGLVSSLLENDVYYSFDFGDRDHGQLWWYDEYDINLGEPVGEAQSLSGVPKYREDVWRRDFSQGVALVNATGEARVVDLGGDFEKISGKQDRSVNNGEITDKVNLGAKDGLIMLKTFQTIKNVVFGNGYFLRFFDLLGARARNGFFAYEEGAPGGAKIYHGDLNADGAEEKIIESEGNLEIYNSSGAHWFNEYLLGDNFKGEVQLAVGKLLPGGQDEILAASSKGGKVLLYNYHGSILRDDFYPLGKKYRSGFTVAIGNIDGGEGEAIFGSTGEVLVYDSSLAKIKKRFFPYEKNFKGGVIVATGDVNGDLKDEIITLPLSKRKSLVRVFNGSGKKLTEFSLGSVLGGTGFMLGATDITFDGKDEVVVGSK